MTAVQVHMPLQDLVFLTSPFLRYKHPHTHAWYLQDWRYGHY